MAVRLQTLNELYKTKPSPLFKGRTKRGIFLSPFRAGVKRKRGIIVKPISREACRLFA